MKWTKLGLVYCADGQAPWAKTHAYIPTPLILNKNVIRLYVAFLDADRMGRIGYVDVSASNPMHVLRVSEKPVLDIGVAGTFDDAGVTPISVVRDSSKIYLYYVGWQRGVAVPYFLYTGLAESIDGGNTFTRVSKVPVLDRSDSELFVRTAAFVSKNRDKWRMWYIAGSAWFRSESGKTLPSYDLRYLESDSPERWAKNGVVCFKPAPPDEFGIGRPFILETEAGYRMWYSIRSKGRHQYRLGYAESQDGVSWQRKDHLVGIEPSAKGWDSEMICFASLVQSDHGLWMFYNGNNFGETGFGVAHLAKE